MKLKSLTTLSLTVLFLLSCGNSDGAREAKDCVVTNCHGKEVTCGFGEALMCTEQYVIGDLCRQYVECKVQDGVCVSKELDKYQKCVACIRTCESKNAIETFQCDEGCRTSLK